MANVQDKLGEIIGRKGGIAQPFNLNAKEDPAEVKQEPKPEIKNVKDVPYVDQFDQMIAMIKKFLQGDKYCRQMQLTLVWEPGEKVAHIRQFKRSENWATLRRGRGWHSVYKGSLLARMLLYNADLKKFFR